MKLWSALTAGSVAAGIGIAGAGTLRWQRATSRSIERLTARAQRSADDALQPACYSSAACAALPDAVARYFRFALTPGQPPISRARLSQRGKLRGGRDARWAPFKATQYFSGRTAGFVWDATVPVVPLLPFASVRIRDSYVDGEAASEASFAGVVALGRQRATPEVTSASLVRYLAETAWLPIALLPHALLPSERLEWHATGERTARVTLTAGATSVWVDVTFGERGEIERIETVRYRDVKGTPTLTPWIGRFSDYALVQGMNVPLAAEVAWSPPEGFTPVWSGRIVAATYEFST